jgi:hypothetical protein
MRRTPSLVSLLTGLCLGGVLFLAGCKQATGDRCEVDNDCQTGLVCSVGAKMGMGMCCTPGTPLCTSEMASIDAGGGRDTGAAPAADAAVITDAMVDGSTDTAAAAADGSSDAPADGATDLAPLDGSATN